jgi:hypothetical protein
MMHFHFNEQAVADHEAALHDRSSAYRLVGRVAPQTPWYRHITRRLRRTPEPRSIRPQSAIAQSTVPIAQP